MLGKRTVSKTFHGEYVGSKLQSAIDEAQDKHSSAHAEYEKAIRDPNSEKEYVEKCRRKFEDCVTILNSVNQCVDYAHSYQSKIARMEEENEKLRQELVRQENRKASISKRPKKIVQVPNFKYPESKLQ